MTLLGSFRSSTAIRTRAVRLTPVTVAGSNPCASPSPPDGRSPATRMPSGHVRSIAAGAACGLTCSVPVTTAVPCGILAPRLSGPPGTLTPSTASGVAEPAGKTWVRSSYAPPAATAAAVAFVAVAFPAPAISASSPRPAGPGTSTESRWREAFSAARNPRQSLHSAAWRSAAPGYNRGLVSRGLLSPVSPVTVAGIAGTLYTVPGDRKSTAPGDDKWTTDDTSADTQIALENGTFAPLMRQTSTANGRYVQREELLSRERLSGSAAASAKLSRAAHGQGVAGEGAPALALVGHGAARAAAP